MSALEIQALGNQSLKTVAQDVNYSRWVSAAAVTILVYDTLLTLGDEVRLIWPKKLSAIKVLTNLNRILAFTFIILNAHQLCALQRNFSDHFCEVLLVSTGVGALCSFAMSNWILLARTKALLGDSRILNYSLVAYYIVSYSATAVLVLHTSYSLLGFVFYSKVLHVCGIAIRPKTMGYIWLPPMVFETTVFLFTIFQLYQKAIETNQMGSNLLVILYRDGVCYYFVIIGLRVFNFLVWLVFPMSLTLIGIFLLWAVMTIAVMRLQLNLLKAVEPGAKPSISFLTRKRHGAFPSVPHNPSRNRTHTIEVTTTTTQHRDYPPTSEFFQLRSVGEPRRQEYDPYRAEPPRRQDYDQKRAEPPRRQDYDHKRAEPPRRQDYDQKRAEPPRRQDHDQYRPPPRTSSRGQVELQNEIGDARAAVEMRAILNSRGRVILRQVDSREVPNWEKARSRDRLV